MGIQVLVVEDDHKIAASVKEVLERDGYDVSLARTGEDGFFRATTERFDLMVLDLGLPGRDGLEILQALRERDRELPVLVLSSRSDVGDRVAGLQTGADDYLVKPFAMAELLARLEALLRRGRSDLVLRFNIKDLFVDVVTRKVARAGRSVDLTVREFELLEYLVRHAHETVTRNMLARDIWKEVNRVTPLDNVIDVHIAHLRRKIDLPGLVRLIHTIRGIGFCLSDKEPD